MLPDVEDKARIESLSDLIEGVGGELSTFGETHGFALDGVDLSTSILPEGWRGRLVRVSNSSTKDVISGRQYTGWCLASPPPYATKTSMRDLPVKDSPEVPAAQLPHGIAARFASQPSRLS